MRFLAQGTLNLDISVEVDAINCEDALMKSDALINSIIEEVKVLTFDYIPITLKVHNSDGVIEKIIKIKKENSPNCSCGLTI